jgi:hypothetical protein
LDEDVCFRDVAGLAARNLRQACRLSLRFERLPLGLTLELQFFMLLLAQELFDFCKLLPVSINIVLQAEFLRAAV